MKVKVAVIGLLVVLVAVVAGCGGSHRYDSRLVLADSLMQANPDSALALVQAVDADSLSTEGDRAYRDLLLTQARYKCYITATSDSAINRALAYYRHHKGEREKLTRAYIYKGAVMQELGHPDSAMHYYKTAEATADPTDYFNRGFCNLRIGELYQFTSADSIVKTRMRKAMECFITCRDTNYIIISMGRLGSYLDYIHNDSAIFFLNQALFLARLTNSPHLNFYQSKLAGIFFYKQDYQQAKNLAMDIINNRDYCDERMFYYYAARSFIQLGNMDSASWVASIIPPPVLPLDSFNHYLLQAELAKANHDMVNYGLCSANAERIHRTIVENNSNPTLLLKELECDASWQHAQMKSEYNTCMIWIIVLVLIAFVALVAITRAIIKNRNNRFRQEMDLAQQEITELVNNSEKQMFELLAEREKVKQINLELSQINKEKHQLEKQQDSINNQAARIAKYRNAALNELYLGIKIKKASDDGKNRPLMETLKDLYEKNRIMKMVPNKSFWDNLRLSVEGEYPGIISFMEQNYPDLTTRDMQLFLLMCADFPNQIISICMNYTGEGTASKRKKNLLQNKMGLDMKMDQFINLYINDELGKQ